MEQLDKNKRIYGRFIDLLNAQDFGALPEVVYTEKYHEICEGFTPGKVNLADAITSLKKVLKGIPNLKATMENCIAEGDKVYARLKVSGTQKGSLYGIPATNHSFEIQMFDFVEIENEKIIDRVQQSDSLGQFISIFKGTIIKTGIILLLLIVGLILAVALK